MPDQCKELERRDFEKYRKMHPDRLAAKLIKAERKSVRTKCPCCKGTALRYDVRRFGMCGDCEFG